MDGGSLLQCRVLASGVWMDNHSFSFDTPGFFLHIRDVGCRVLVLSSGAGIVAQSEVPALIATISPLPPLAMFPIRFTHASKHSR